jgi:putative endopeptidase
MSRPLLLAIPLLSAAVLAADPTTKTRPAPRGIDVGGMDPSVAPGDEFFLHANGSWLKRTEIPADKPAWGAFNILAEESTVRTRALVEAAAASTAPAGSSERKVGDFFSSFMDEATVEARGLQPLRPELDVIAAIRDRKALARAIGQALRVDVDPLNNTKFQTSRLFGFWVSADLNAPEQYTAYLFQGGLGMPDREYYLNPGPKMAAARAAYREHTAKVLTLAGIADAEAKARRIVALETEIAKVHASRAESMEVKRASPWKRTEFGKRAPGFEWTAFFEAAGLKAQPELIVWHPKAVTGLAALVAKQPLGTWKEWMAFHAIDRNAPLLPRAFADESFAFYGKTLTGQPQQSDRWKRAVVATNLVLGDAVGQMYVKRYFPPESKAQVETMVRNIIAAFGKRIDALAWMNPQTKAHAKEKLSTLYVGVGYPEKWTDYGPYDVARSDLFGNVERSGFFELRRALARLGKPVDKTEWCMVPQTVNAVNLPLQNAMNFPAAILEPPFFDPLATAAVNYGGIGTVIGHEISHSFDDQGALFDAQGKVSNWWTPEDYAHFENSGARLAAQYDTYKPFPDLAVNGKQTLSENIADVAGLSAAHDAWLMSLAGKPAPVVDGLSGDQQFFLSYAQVWRTKMREPLLRQQVVADGHAPSQYRGDAVRNIDPWYQAFNVKPGQALYLAPPERIQVW